MVVRKIIDQISGRTYNKEVHIERNDEHLMFTLGQHCLEVKDKITIYDDPAPSDGELKHFELDEWRDALDYFDYLTSK